MEKHFVPHLDREPTVESVPHDFSGAVQRFRHAIDLSLLSKEQQAHAIENFTGRLAGTGDLKVKMSPDARLRDALKYALDEEIKLCREQGSGDIGKTRLAFSQAELDTMSSRGSFPPL